ncbi:hypothetical protein [Aureimonas sp. Leaf324]|jgi:molybdenum-dependent DNA-binding transcriptional regulator ModE|uniref:hypothetical protein n=1 Tax=Aureimonas sp. Leaf324 TaxID=1736336 RepID=UPI0006F4BCFE|nr:hypothetical protein [Aureimonas sp. Leaf324]KQQ90263.1 hypothetical protein ASF65_15540 [Aureimonas sp. Leaf324]
MPVKRLPWRKFTPAQIALIERLSAAGGNVLVDELQYGEQLALNELRQLKLAEMRLGAYSKLEAVLTAAGAALRDKGFTTDRVVLHVTPSQAELLRFLDDGCPSEESIGSEPNSMSGQMKDVCRRMCLRGWAERHGGRDGLRWVRLTPAGHEVLAAVNEWDQAIREAGAIERHQLH